MAWIEALLRGQKVLARTGPDGALLSEGGRVEIRYKPKDARAYRAAVANLVVTPGARSFDDAHCVEGEPVEKSPTPRAKKPAPAAAPTPAAGTVVVYTDGACSGNPGPAGCGVVVVDPSGKIREASEWLGEATNNIAELTAILRGLEAVDAETPVQIHTDSQYSIGVLQKGWRAKANQELVARVRAALVARPLARLVYVPGHAGVPLNERADELARQAVSNRRSTPLA